MNFGTVWLDGDLGSERVRSTNKYPLNENSKFFSLNFSLVLKNGYTAAL